MPKTILIVEDDTDILDMMTYILTDEGYKVAAFQDTLVLEQVTELQPALILLDNRLQGGFGSDLCLKLKSDPATRHFPVVLVSAARELEQVAAACLADGYLSKPFAMEDLIAIAGRFSS